MLTLARFASATKHLSAPATTSTAIALPWLAQLKKYDVDELSRMGFLKNIAFLTEVTDGRSQGQSQQPAIH